MSDLQFKVIFVGKSGVGKTAIVRRFTKRFFPTIDLPTVAVDVGVKGIHCDGTKMQIKIWDSSGLEKFKSLARSYFRNADAAVLVYSVTDQGSLYDLQSWSREVMAHTDAIRILLGNKSDLESDRKIPSELAFNLDLLENIDTAMQCSAKEDDNIDFLFDVLAKRLLAKHEKHVHAGQDDRHSSDAMLQNPCHTRSASDLFLSPKATLTQAGMLQRMTKNAFQRIRTLFQEGS